MLTGIMHQVVRYASKLHFRAESLSQVVSDSRKGMSKLQWPEKDSFRPLRT